MKKKFRHTEKAVVRCISCNSPMKKNVVERKPTAKNCYKCYSGMRQSGSPDREARSVRVPRNYRLSRRDQIAERQARRKRLGI